MHATYSNNMIKDVPSLRSYACSVMEDTTAKDKIEKEFKGKWKLEKALNKNKILMPHDGRSVVLIYGKE